MSDTVELPLEKFEETITIMKEVRKKVEEVEKKQISEEEYMGKAEELVKKALAEQMEVFNKEREKQDRQMRFPVETFNSDPCIEALRTTKGLGVKDKDDDGVNRFSKVLTLPTKDERIRRLQELADDTLIVNAWMQRNPNYVAAGGMRTLKTFKKFAAYRDEVMKAIAPMDTVDTGDWVPTAMSSAIIDLPIIYGQIEPLFEHIDCPTKVYDYPINLTGPDTKCEYVAEATTNTSNPGDTGGQNLTDGKITFTAKKLRSRMLVSSELEEDAIIPVLPAIKMGLKKLLDQGVEDCILNGDTTDPHQDTDTTAGSGDVRTTWKGLRKLFLAGSLSMDLSTLSLDNLFTLAALAGKWAARPSECVWIVGIKYYLKNLRAVDEVITVDKYGPQATVITGELGKLGGSPVLMSEYQREDVGVAGVNAESGNTYSTLIYVNRNAFKIGDRRLITLRGEFWPTSEQWNLCAFRRLDFEPFAAPSTTYSLGAIGYKCS